MKKLLKLCPSIKKRTPLNLLFKNLKIMKPEDILLHNNCNFVYNQINENFHESFKDYFQTV